MKRSTLHAALAAVALCCATVHAAPADPAKGEAISCPPTFSGSGQATAYAPGTENACMLDTPADGLATAISAPDWNGSAHCGECLLVTGPAGSAVVRVVDQCPSCPAGDLDLQPAAWNAVTGSPDGAGRAEVSWTRVACPVSGPVAVRLQGSNAYYINLQVRAHRHGVAGVTLDLPDGPVALLRSGFNYFQASLSSPVPTPFDVLITATTGEMLREQVVLTNDIDQPGTSQFAHCTSAIFRDGFEAAVPPGA